MRPTNYTPTLSAIAGEAVVAKPIEFVDVGAMLESEPPPRTYLFVDKYGRGFMPAGEGHGFAGVAGSGKSNVEFQKMIALAGGVSFLNYERVNAEPMHAIFYTLEDDIHEVHRRLVQIYNGMERNLEPGARIAFRGNLRKYLHIAPLVGRKFMLTAEAPREFGQAFTDGPAVQTIIDNIESLAGGSAYVSIDPLRRVTVGKEDGEAMNAVIGACDRIRSEASGEVTTCIIHHTAKLAGKDGELGQDVFRGAGDLVAGLRWTMTLANVDPKSVSNYHMDGQPITPDQAIDLRRYAMPKSNYERRRGESFLIWRDGIFEPADVVNVHSARQSQRFDDAIAPLLAKMHSIGKPVTARTLRPFARKNGVIPISEKDLGALLELAVAGEYVSSGAGRRKSTVYRPTGKPYETEGELLAREIQDYRASSNG